jgi:ABC-type branched-subunit amino acid transport system ATPase component
VASPVLDIRELSVRFGGLTALDGVNLTVDAGARVGLIGPNGAGKTTLFNAVSGFVHPAGGEIWVSGERLTDHHQSRRAHLGVARTFQHPQLCSALSALDNVLIGVPEPSGLGLLARDLIRPSSHRRVGAAQRQQALELLDLLGCAAAADTPVSRLPLGVLRRVEAARALLARPSLLLLDEPASGMGSDEAQDLLAHLLELQAQHGMAMLLIEHNMRFLMQAVDDVYVLDFGRLLAHGAPDAIRTDERVIGAYLGTEKAS